MLPEGPSTVSELPNVLLIFLFNLIYCVTNCATDTSEAIRARTLAKVPVAALNHKANLVREKNVLSVL